uniref:PARP catalytic domain-containing protein n=1 Tax=Gadus morhua TaxID=8049 RepID=A0A8C4ZH25_GADMO
NWEKSYDPANCGRTYVMYHGTTRTNATAIQRNGFKQSEDGMLGRGVYLSRDLKKASRYPFNTPDSERVVFRVKVNVGNVFDTAWCPPDCGMTKRGLEEDCVWDPSRIKIDKCLELLVKTHIMYHQDQFNRHPAKWFQTVYLDGMRGRGVFLSRDMNKAKRVVFRVKVNVGNVIAINRQRHPRQKNWHDYRYGEVFDTAWCPPDCGMTKSGLEEDCVWDPNRIKIDRCIAPTPAPLMQGHTVAEAPGSMAEAPGAMIIMGMGIILSFIFAIFGSR